MNIGLTKRDLFRFMKGYSEKSLRDILSQDKKFWTKVEKRAQKLYDNEKFKTVIAKDIKRDIAPTGKQRVMAYGMKDWLDAIVIKKNSIFSRLLFLEHCKKITSMLKQSSEQRINKKGLDELVVNALVSFKNGPATTVVPVKLAESDCILKRYNARSAIHVVSRALRQTRAMRCWQRSYDFAKAGINVATPIMMYEQRIGPIRLDAYFVCDKLEGEELLGLLPMMSLAQQQSVFCLLYTSPSPRDQA